MLSVAEPAKIDKIDSAVQALHSNNFPKSVTEIGLCFSVLTFFKCKIDLIIFVFLGTLE